jgi:hypothetical protein
MNWKTSGSGRGLLKILSRQFLEVTEENYKKNCHDSPCTAEIRTEHIPNESEETVQLQGVATLPYASSGPTGPVGSVS